MNPFSREALLCTVKHMPTPHIDPSPAESSIDPFDIVTDETIDTSRELRSHGSSTRSRRSEPSLHNAILSSLVQVHRARKEEEREFISAARAKQQSISLLQNIDISPARELQEGHELDPVEKIASLQLNIDRLELEIETLKGQKLEYLSHRQIEQLYGTLSSSLKLVKERRKNLRRKQKEQLKSCVICLESHRNVVFQCGHLITCSECSQSVQECPVCRIAIQSRITVHGNSS